MSFIFLDVTINSFLEMKISGIVHTFTTFLIVLQTL